MRTFIYPSQFRLNVEYRLGKKQVIPDGLSRLFSNKKPTNFKLLRNFPTDFLDLDIYFCGIFFFG